MLHILALPLVGFVVGALVVTLGGGGGAIYVGLLTTLFGVAPALAASASLATVIPTTMVGAFSHWRAGNVRLRLGLIMLSGGVAGAFVGASCSKLLPEAIYQKLTGIVLLFFAIRMLVSFLSKRRGKKTGVGAEGGRGKRIAAALAYGFIGGALSGLVGLSGGGPIIAGLSALGCSALETVGTSIFVILGVSIAGFAVHLGLGSVAWSLVLPLLAGTVTGAVVAPLLLKRVDKALMEKILGPILILLQSGMGLVLIFRP